MRYIEIITHFYPTDTPLRRLLLQHSTQVRDKALAICDAVGAAGPQINREAVIAGAMLHDIGIIRCQAPDIFCNGKEPYIAHGIIGASMLRDYACEHGMDLENCARVCERHTGVGITAAAIRTRNIPLPERDYVPETPEEKLICLADKFFSKSGDRLEKTLAAARKSLAKFGDEGRFDALCTYFGISADRV